MTLRPGLVVDLTGAQSLEYGDRGVARYTQELAAALARVPGAVSGLLLNPTLPIPGSLHPELLASPLLRWNTATEMRRLLSAGPLAYLMPSPLELGPPSATMPPPHVVQDGIPILAVLYDLIPLIAPDRHMDNPDVARRYRLRVEVYRDAERLLALSRWSAAEAVRLLDVDPARLVVMGGGVAPVFGPARGAGVERDGVIYVAGSAERKNVPRLVRAWALVEPAVRRGSRLAIVCSLDHAPTVDAWRAEIARMGLEESVVLTGRVSDDQLAAMLNRARLHVFASLYEGFALPVAEGIACGCPTITASTGATPEILDDPSTVFDPADERAIAARIERALGDPDELLRLRDLALRRAPLYNWDSVAQRVVDVVESLEAPPRGRPPRRRRVALVGCLPPSASPSATPNAALLAALADRCEVHAFTDVPASNRDGDAVRFPIGSLERRGLAAGYDALVFGLAGHPDDAATLAVARRLPGVVWLHDLAGAHREIVRRARRLVVGSHAQAHRLRLDQGPGDFVVPVDVVEHGDAGERAQALLHAIDAAGRS